MTASRAPAPSPYFEALREQLVEAAARTSTRRRSRKQANLIVAAAAVVLTVGTGMLLYVDPQPANAAVDVRRSGDRVELRLVGDRVEPEDVERAARQAGIRVSVSRRPVGPSLVNRFVAFEPDRSLPASFIRLDDRSGIFRGFSLPLSWPGSLHLGLGQPARGDERYTKTSDAFAPGEPLACLDIRGRPAPDAANALATHTELRVRWELEAPQGWRATTPRQSPRAKVVRADAHSPSEVVVFVAEGPAPPYRPPTGCKRRG